MKDDGISYRPHNWLNTQSNKPVFGIQAKRPGGKWLHMARDSQPLLFNTAEERDAEIERLCAA